jgi:predicted RNase H-like HicB family nuclease
MAVVYFPAIVETGPGGGYGVFFPDLPGCVSAGDSLQEAARNAEIALQLHLAGMVEDGEAIPGASELDALARDPEVEEAARILVRGETPGRVERVNITMEEGLLKVIDAAAEQRGMTRSGFLAEGARQLISASAGRPERYTRIAGRDPMPPRGAGSLMRSDDRVLSRAAGGWVQRDAATGQLRDRPSAALKKRTAPTAKKK